MSKRVSLVAVAALVLGGVSYAGAAHSAEASCRVADGTYRYVDAAGASTHVVVTESRGRLRIATGASSCTIVHAANFWHVVLSMGDGNDRVEFNAADKTLVVTGGAGDDRIAVQRTLGAQVFGDDAEPSRSDGNDTIDAYDDVQVFAGGGNDVVTMHGTEYDEVHGGDGNDALTGGRSIDRMWGEGGDDLVNGAGGRDVLYGGDGDDVIDGGGDAERMISGGPGDDTAAVTRGDRIGMNADGTPDVEHVR